LGPFERGGECVGSAEGRGQFNLLTISIVKREIEWRGKGESGKGESG
jgi:hypothetical protein